MKNLTEHPAGSDEISLCREAREKQPQDIVNKMNTWLAVNDKSAFKPTSEIKGLYAKAQIIVCIVIKI
ncbi:bacteriocin immunity protein [Kosakonia sacchari]|uniref:bacteriocin immunity protein n=1 Tax=Kosakonia sacchari TaxID=1158459 RepID=UPI0015853BAB|nr:bacteriocin immunity protein [Kosakonia sacchari]